MAFVTECLNAGDCLGEKRDEDVRDEPSSEAVGDREDPPARKIGNKEDWEL